MERKLRKYRDNLYLGGIGVITELDNKRVDELSIYVYAMKLADKALPLERCPGMCFWGFDEPGNMRAYKHLHCH